MLFVLKIILVSFITYSDVGNDRVFIDAKVMGTFEVQDALSFIKKRQQLILSQFQPNYDPYTGMDTIPEKCQLKNLPEPKVMNAKTYNYSLLSIYASKNKNIADCSNSDQLLKLQYLILYCRDTKEITISKGFYGANKKWKFKPFKTCPGST